MCLLQIYHRNPPNICNIYDHNLMWKIYFEKPSRNGILLHLNWNRQLSEKALICLKEIYDWSFLSTQTCSVIVIAITIRTTSAIHRSSDGFPGWLGVPTWLARILVNNNCFPSPVPYFSLILGDLAILPIWGGLNVWIFRLARLVDNKDGETWEESTVGAEAAF